MALALDGSTPAVATTGSASTTVVTAQFSPPANAVLFACIACGGDGTTGYTATPSNSGTALTWNLLKRENTFVSGQLTGTCEVWWANSPAAQTNITVTGTFNRATVDTSPSCLLQVLVFTGANTSQATAANTSINNSAGTGTFSAAVNTTVNNSWIWGCCQNWSSSTVGTAGGSQTVQSSESNAGASAAYWCQKQNATTPVSGTNVTINDTAPTNVSLHMVVFEVLPTGAAAPTMASAILYIPPQPFPLLLQQLNSLRDPRLEPVNRPVFNIRAMEPPQLVQPMKVAPNVRDPRLDFAQPSQQIRILLARPQPVQPVNQSIVRDPRQNFANPTFYNVSLNLPARPLPTMPGVFSSLQVSTGPVVTGTLPIWQFPSQTSGATMTPVDMIDFR